MEKCKPTRKHRCSFTTSICLLSCNCSGNVCSPIVRQALRRSPILVWVGQRSKVTIDQRREEYHLWDTQFRTSCCPGLPILKAVRLQHRYHRTRWERGGTSTQETGSTCFKFIFKFSIRAKWRTCIQKTDSIRSSLLLTGLRAECERKRVACIRT